MLIRLHVLALAIACSFAALILAPAAYAAPPANDDFANAIVLPSGSASDVVDNTEATLEVGEPNSSNRSASVWYSWTAPSDGFMSANSCAGGWDSEMYIYSGIALTALNQKADGSDFCATNSGAQTPLMQVAQGDTLMIQHLSYSTNSGLNTVEVEFIETPAHDDLIAAEVLSGDVDSSEPAFNRYATVESGETTSGGGGTRTMWYSWQAPAPGLATFSSCDADFDAFLRAYTGDPLAGGTVEGSADQGCPNGSGSRFTIPVTGGVTYLLQHAGYGGYYGTATVSVSLERTPANDDFANATVLDGNKITLADDNRLATAEAGQPNFASGLYAGPTSVWYRWTAPSSGLTEFSVCSDFDAVGDVFTGSSVDELTKVAFVSGNGDNGCSPALGSGPKFTFNAVQGTTYHFGVGGYSSQTGTFNVSLTMAPTNLTAPTVSGQPFVGSDLTGLDGTWGGAETLTYARQWLSCDSAATAPADCAELDGSTGSTQELQPADDGKVLRLRVTVSNDVGAATAYSEATAVIDVDDDGDGVGNDNDNCDNDANPGQTNSDDDADGNACDADDDNDGALDGDDAFSTNPAEQIDTDGDNIGNNADTDDDGDTLLDTVEATRGTNPLLVDTDSDTVSDAADNCALISNTGQINSDSDALGNACDADDDNDGALDGVDAFPTNAAEQLDTDSDGIGNNADTDDDGDTVSDAAEATAGTNPLVKDTDGDGVADGADSCGTVAASTANGCTAPVVTPPVVTPPVATPPVVTPPVAAPPVVTPKPPVNITGTAKADKILGNALANLIRMGAGNDRCDGMGGNDKCFGEAGNDTCIAKEGNDTCDGGAGNDVCTALAGTDKCLGGAGNDTANTFDRKGGDVINGGPGKDKCTGDKKDKFIACEIIIKK